MHPPIPLVSPLHVYRVWNPRTREVYATPGASDRAQAEQVVRDTVARFPDALVQVYQKGEWRPWLSVAGR
jgi:hypothetical protein